MVIEQLLLGPLDPPSGIVDCKIAAVWSLLESTRNPWSEDQVSYDSEEALATAPQNAQRFESAGQEEFGIMRDTLDLYARTPRSPQTLQVIHQAGWSSARAQKTYCDSIARESRIVGAGNRNVGRTVVSKDWLRFFTCSMGILDDADRFSGEHHGGMISARQ